MHTRVLGRSIVDAFQGVGTTEPVRRTDSQKALLLNLIIFWTDQTDGALPQGIYDLRYALHDDLRNVGLEASDD